MPKFNNVLLIDDDPISLLINEKLIKITLFATEVGVCENGRSAFDLLATLKNSNLIPQVIFLDITMPIMDGWDFLFEIEKIKSSFKIIPQIYLLSSSIDPDDYQRAESFSFIHGFISKPLTADKLNEINKIDIDNNYVLEQFS